MRGGELRRAEGGEDVLGGAFVLRQEVCGLLLRDDDHGDHATEEHEHAGDGEARNQVFDEQCAEHGADRSADGGAGAVEGGHGATDLGRHTVGQDGDHRRDHAVQTEHAGAVEDGQQHGVMRGAGQEQGDATEHGSEEDPRGTAAEAGTGAIGEVAEHQVGDQGCDRGERVDDADQRIGVDARDGLVVHGQQHCGNDAQTGHPQHSEYQEACAETCGVHLGQRLAGFRGQRRILFRRGDVGVVSGKALRLAGDCFTHETLSFESCFSSELMLCAIPHLSGVCGGGTASPHLLTTMW